MISGNADTDDIEFLGVDLQQYFTSASGIGLLLFGFDEDSFPDQIICDQGDSSGC